MSLVEDAVTAIDVKQAVQAAKKFAPAIFEPEKISALGLEAVERSEDGRYWLVTLGFSRPEMYPKTGRDWRRHLSPLEQVLPSREPAPLREYKVFKVDAVSGEVVEIQLFEE